MQFFRMSFTYSTAKSRFSLILFALAASSLLAFLLQRLYQVIRKSYCPQVGCAQQESPTRSLPAIQSQSPAKCTATSFLLARGSDKRIRDKILLLGSQNSIAEYVLPLMHLASFDSSLSDSSSTRRGASAVKYGYPISVSSPEARLLLFKIGFADAVVISPDKLRSPLDKALVKYYFRLQPYKSRLNLPAIPASLGISEDSEVLTAYMFKNPALFNRNPYSCV
jgi:hypothetical protein